MRAKVLFKVALTCVCRYDQNMNNTQTTPNQTVANLKALIASRKNGTMNGLEILDAYRALHPVTDEPLTITFTDMYQALLSIVGYGPVPVRFSVNRRA